MRIQGISGSRGVAVGNVYRYIQEEIVIPDYNVTEDKVEEEIGKFATAMASTLKQLDTIRKKALDEMGPEEAAIFEAHMQIAQDPSLSDGIKSLVESSHMNVVAAKPLQISFSAWKTPICVNEAQILRISVIV